MKVLEIEGVKVQRPMPYDFSQVVRTPDFESQGKINLILRNIQVKEYYNYQEPKATYTAGQQYVDTH